MGGVHPWKGLDFLFHTAGSSREAKEAMMSKVILVIEDQEDNRRIVHDLLTSKGYEVIETVNGLDGVNAASLALMFFVTYQLGRAALVDVPSTILAVATSLIVFRFAVNSAWLVLGGGLLGLLLSGRS